MFTLKKYFSATLLVLYSAVVRKRIDHRRQVAPLKIYLPTVASLFLLYCAGIDRWAERQSEKNVPAIPLGLDSCNYLFARKFTGKYCMECHSADGTNPKQEKAYPNLGVANYREWMEASGAVPGVLDKAALEGPVMPPKSAKNQPTDEERKIMVEWVRRGSPNTDSGR